MKIEDFFGKIVSFDKKQFLKDWKTAFFNQIPVQTTESGIVFNVFFNENTNCLYCTLYLNDKENENILLNLTENQLSMIERYWEKGIPLVIYKDERYKTIINDFNGITFEAILLADFLLKH